ncbi:hypothetical protein EG240_11345 [Paenimyroides tangerinum]|uniref:Uncharacterized protein n=1 Tax=Paenimyroides tangerinum TaxID=2488728 RepID=A0A3P3W508_9FLAO|nr:DUF6642 family protein [Paenimyroides tangerinum]RRJ89518.1 hypothetical protein EG240_11345 [Paenimyroides tangerinum]
MNLPNDSYSLFCLESVIDSEIESESKLFPMLEQITLNFGVTNVYKNCDSIESFQESLETLLYTDRDFKHYEVIYFVFEGSNNNIEIDGYLYSFEEIAELFQGKLNGKILHFANTKELNLDQETAQYFLAVTGAKAISGYVNHTPILSTILDFHYFGLYQEYDDVIELVENLLEKHYALCSTMGFRLYY